MSNNNRLDDFDLYCTVRQIGDRTCEIAKKHGCWFEDWRTETSNPFYCQTAGGLFVEHYYGSVGTLWTPWGKWGFIGSSSGNWDDVWKEVAELLGATLHKPKVINTMGEFGPVFAITKFRQQSLPEAVALNRSEYDSYEDVTAAWAKMTARYQSKKNQ